MKNIELFLKFLWIFDKIVRILADPDARFRNSQLRIRLRIREANYGSTGSGAAEISFRQDVG
jgi:hypothetical protein